MERDGFKFIVLRLQVHRALERDGYKFIMAR